MVLQWPPHLTVCWSSLTCHQNDGTAVATPPVFWSSLTCHQNNGTAVATPPNCVLVKSYLSPKQWYCSGHPTYLCSGQVLPVIITMVLQWPPHLTVFWSSLTCHQNNGTAVATPPNCVLVKSYLSPKQWYCSGHPTWRLVKSYLSPKQWYYSGHSTWLLALACGTDWPGVSIL